MDSNGSLIILRGGESGASSQHRPLARSPLPAANKVCIDCLFAPHNRKGSRSQYNSIQVFIFVFESILDNQREQYMRTIIYNLPFKTIHFLLPEADKEDFYDDSVTRNHIEWSRPLVNVVFTINCLFTKKNLIWNIIVLFTSSFISLFNFKFLCVSK